MTKPNDSEQDNDGQASSIILGLVSLIGLSIGLLVGFYLVVSFNEWDSWVLVLFLPGLYGFVLGLLSGGMSVRLSNGSMKDSQVVAIILTTSILLWIANAPNYLILSKAFSVVTAFQLPVILVTSRILRRKTRKS